MPSSFAKADHTRSKSGRSQRSSKRQDDEDSGSSADADAETDLELRAEKCEKLKDPDTESDSWNWTPSDRELPDLPDDGIPLDDPVKIVGIASGEKPVMVSNLRMAIPRTVVS